MKKHHVIPSSLNKRLISTLMSTRKVDPNESKTFALKSTSEFASRSGDVFGKLQSLEKTHETWVSKNDPIEYFDESNELADSKPDPPLSGKSISKKEVTTKPDSSFIKSNIEIPGKAAAKIPGPNLDAEAVFKKPLPVKKWKRKAGGFYNFERQPKKWTRYSLEDVPISSDITNAAVAFQFLNDLSSRKDPNVDTDESSDKIVFKKPRQKVDTEESVDNIVFKKPKQRGQRATGRITTRVSLAAEAISESHGEKKEVLSELKASSSNITLAHLEEE